MPELTFARPATDAELAAWRHIHNVIVPPDALTLDQVRERNGRNHLEIVRLDGEPVGCSTVRPPTADHPATATVIARVLPPFRGRGIGTRLHGRGLDHARGLGATVIETIVLASNTAGLRFAEHHGYVEFDRYVLDGDTIAYVDLRLT